MKANSNTTFKPRELVWAKIHGYPWWPGIINNIDESYDEPNYMINFFGDTTYSFLDKTKLFKFQEKFGIYSKGQNKQLKVAINLAVDYLSQRGISIDYLNSNQRNLESTDRSSSNTSSLIHNINSNISCNKKEQAFETENQLINQKVNSANSIIQKKKANQENKEQNIDDFKPKPLTQPLSKSIKKQKFKKTQKVIINIQQEIQNDKMIIQDNFSHKIFESPQQHQNALIIQFQVNQQGKKRQATHVLDSNQSLEVTNNIFKNPQQLISEKSSRRLCQSQKILLFDNLQKWTKNSQQQIFYLKSLQIGDEQIKQLLNQYHLLPVIDSSIKLPQKSKLKSISQIKTKKQKIQSDENRKQRLKQQTINKFSQYLRNQKYKLTSQKSKFHAQIFQFLISSSSQSTKYHHKIQIWSQILHQAQFSVEKLHELIKHFVQ